MEAHQVTDHIDDNSCALDIAMNEMDDNELLLTNISGTSMHQLNDYCLLDIFSYHSLSPMDLCSLAETCKRFKKIVQFVFPKKFKIEPFFGGEDHIFKSSSTSSIYYLTVDNCERILRNFGSRLAHYEVRNGAVLNSVAKYCDGAALEHLIISSPASVHKIAAKLKSIFERMLRLTIFGTATMDVKSTEIIRCDSLVELELPCSDDCLPFLRNNTFPNLRRFKVSGKTYQIDDAFFNFMSRHKLNCLKFCQNVRCNSGHLQKINESCKELKELVICFSSREDTADFSKLKNLTKLEILEIFIQHGAKFLLEIKSLKTLRLTNSCFERHIPAHFLVILSQLPNFRELSLSDYPNQTDWSMIPKLKRLVLENPRKEFCAADLQRIIKQLPTLEELELGSKCKLELNENDFLAIAKIVQGRANVLTLTCRFNFNYTGGCYDNRRVRLMRIKSFE